MHCALSSIYPIYDRSKHTSKGGYLIVTSSEPWQGYREIEGGISSIATTPHLFIIPFSLKYSKQPKNVGGLILTNAHWKNTLRRNTKQNSTYDSFIYSSDFADFSPKYFSNISFKTDYLKVFEFIHKFTN